MRLPALPPLLLSALNVTDIRGPNTKNNAPVFCYTERPPGEPPRISPQYDDCLQLALRLISGEKPERPLTFSRNGHGIPVPASFPGGTCIFQVNLDRDGDFTASSREIAEKGNDIAVPCVHGPDHLGGKSKVGEDEVLELAVVGRRLTPLSIKEVSRLGESGESRHR